MEFKDENRFSKKTKLTKNQTNVLQKKKDIN